MQLGAPLHVPDVVIVEGPLRVALADVVAAPVLERGERVGLWLEGRGTAALSFPDRGEAIGFADRLVTRRGADPAALAPVAHGERPYEDGVSAVLIATRDAAWLDALVPGDAPAAHPGRFGVGAHRRWALAVGAAPPDVPAREWLVVDTHLDHRHGALPRPPWPAPFDDRWVGLRRTDPRHAELFAATLVDDEPYLATIAHAEAPDAPAPRPVACTVSDGRIEVDLRAFGANARGVATSRYTLRCDAEDQRVFIGPVDGRTRMTRDGAPVDAASTVPVGTTPVTITREDVWFGAIATLTADAWTWALPRPAAEGPIDLVIRHGVDVVAAGAGVEADGALRATTDGPTWLIAGRWRREVAATEPVPVVSHRLARRRGDDPGVSVARWVGYGHTFLPPLGSPRLDVVEDGRIRDGGFATRAGLIVAHRSWRFGERVVDRGALAHAIGHQWWGGLARSGPHGDAWIAEALAESFVCLALAHDDGPAACERRLQDRPRSPRFVGLRSGGRFDPAAQAYAGWLLLRGVRARVGDEVFLRVLHDVTAEAAGTDGLTTAGLEAALTRATGRSWADFFDFWVDAAAEPRVRVAWGPTRATFTSDVPFGTFELPVRVRTGDAIHTVWVPIVDGQGALTFDSPPSDVSIDLRHW